MTIDEFRKAWYLKKARVEFKDGTILTGYALYVSASDSGDGEEEINIALPKILYSAHLSDVKEIVDLDK